MTTSVKNPKAHSMIERAHLTICDIFIEAQTRENISLHLMSQIELLQA